MTSSPTAVVGAAPPLAADAVELVAARQPAGQGFQFRVRASGRVYRLDPARASGQPRFWCVRIARCTPAGLVDPTEPSWYGDGRMTREEVPAAVAAIQTALIAWLALPHHGELQAWVLEARPVAPLPPDLAPTRHRQPRSPQFQAPAGRTPGFETPQELSQKRQDASGVGRRPRSQVTGYDKQR